MTVSDNTIKTEGLGEFCKNLGIKEDLYKKWQNTN